MDHGAIFDQIGGLVDLACRAAAVAPSTGGPAAFADEPINWADLGCAGVEWFTNDGGYSGYRVRVSEAAPNCEALCAFVEAYLAEHGHPDVEVITEW